VYSLLTQVNIPTLLVTHDLAEANLLADRIAVYCEGHILQAGTPAEVMRQPVNLEVARLTGLYNYFAGEVQAVMDQGLKVAIGPLLLDTPPYPFAVGEKVYCCLRPEQVTLLGSDQQDENYTNVAQGQIVSITTDGLSFSVQLCLIEQRLAPDRTYDLVATLPLHVFEALALVVGQVCQILLRRNAIHLMQI
jgi:ABC-type Fe3+/spermidine/putrescine transport system ATPase subunit